MRASIERHKWFEEKNHLQKRVHAVRQYRQMERLRNIIFGGYWANMMPNPLKAPAPPPPLSDHLFHGYQITYFLVVLSQRDSTFSHTHTHTCIYTHAHTHAQTHAHTHTCTHKHKHRGREVLELIQRDKTYMRSIKNSLSHTHMQTHTHIHTHAHTCTHRGRESIVFCVIRSLFFFWSI